MKEPEFSVTTKNDDGWETLEIVEGFLELITVFWYVIFSIPFLGWWADLAVKHKWGDMNQGEQKLEDSPDIWAKKMRIELLGSWALLKYTAWAALM